MNRFWKPVDAQTKAIKKFLDKTRLERTSVIMLDLGLLFLLITPFVNEPPIVYVMSALALIFGGALAIIEANREEIEDDPK